ncbi:MAG TPA: SPFH domain-containing protein [Ktedonobacterales bacterium]|jgi:flotillin
MGLTTVLILAVAIAVFLVLFFWIWGSLLRKVPPNQALIKYGRGGVSVVTGGSAWVWPLFQRAATFSLELMSFDVAPAQDLYSNQGVAVNVEAVTQLKVKSDQESIITAAEQFLSKSWDERQAVIRLVMEGHLRGVVGQLTVEQLVKEPEMVSEKMRQTSSSDMAKMGLEIVSFTIKEVRDKIEFINNMGRPEIERIQKEARIAAALAARDTQIQQADAMRAAAIAKAEADQKRVEAETLSMTKQAEYQRDLALKKAAYDAQVKQEQAKADKSYDVQANVMQQQVITEAVKVQELEKTAQVKVQEAEIQRRELELQATVLKAAEYERKRVETVAEAERQRIALEATGRADATRMAGEAEAAANKARGLAEAELRRAQGLAEAEVIRAKGEAEAEAMRVKAAAYHEYNQAAVMDKLLTSLPEVVRAIAEPLSKVDKVTIVSTGAANGTGLGASRLTTDIVNMVAQAPALFEALTGQKVSDLMSHVPVMNGATQDSASVNGSNGVTVEANAQDEDKTS